MNIYFDRFAFDAINLRLQHGHSPHIVRPFNVSHSFHFILDNYKYLFFFIVALLLFLWPHQMDGVIAMLGRVLLLWRKSNIKNNNPYQLCAFQKEKKKRMEERTLFELTDTTKCN